MKSVSEGSFWEHLEEFRRRLFIVLGSLTVSVLAAFVFSRRLMDIIISKSPMHLRTLAPAEAFSAHLNLSLAAGLIAASPVFFYQFWRFVSPGLYRSERRKAVRAAAVCVLLFLAGAAFAWFLMLDPALVVFRSFETGSIEGSWSLANFIGFLGRFVMIFGTAFQLPVLILMLVGLGVVTPAGLSKYRRHIIVGLLMAAAILTPPDPLTQVMLALPLYLLFELSLLSARIGYRRKTGS
ncbi:MAG: twin-arginine translocase subunit TatC [Candidatus Fermentibacteraceae bacterium]|nr:twin-arginine translocase subunit TatC [Candidatus Fermentibacteraceae bacterium]